MSEHNLSTKIDKETTLALFKALPVENRLGLIEAAVLDIFELLAKQQELQETSLEAMKHVREVIATISKVVTGETYGIAKEEEVKG